MLLFWGSAAIQKHTIAIVKWFVFLFRYDRYISTNPVQPSKKPQMFWEHQRLWPEVQHLRGGWIVYDIYLNLTHELIPALRTNFFLHPQLWFRIFHVTEAASHGSTQHCLAINVTQNQNSIWWQMDTMFDRCFTISITFNLRWPNCA